MTPLNVLVLHMLAPLEAARKTSVDHLLAFQRHAPQHRYVLHDIRAPVTIPLRAIDFDAVLLDSTALCARYYRPRHLFDDILARYRWLADAPAVKVAFPQDEYDESVALDTWLESWSVDIVYTVLPGHEQTFLPRSRLRAHVRTGLTGYIEDSDVEQLRLLWRPMGERVRDIAYRARHLPPYFGRYGALKGEIGDRLRALNGAYGLTIDSSTDPQDVLLGGDWNGFLASSRATVAMEGGSSLHDPYGRIRDAVTAYCAEHPGAAFDEVEAACFPGLDGQVYSAISPRMFEAALVGCVQALLPGEYLGALTPGEHYVPIGADLAEAAELAAILHDPSRAMRTAEACWSVLAHEARFRQSTRVAAVMDEIAELVALARPPSTSPSRFAALTAAHRALSTPFQSTGRVGSLANGLRALTGRRASV